MKTILLYAAYFVSTLVVSQEKIHIEELTITNDSIILPGTLSYTDKSTTLVIWVHGSGNVDRNGQQGNLVKANYIEQFRNAINTHDIAFFSFDKRTATPENFKFMEGTVFEDLVSDVQHVITNFKKDKRFSRCVLAGHSQGSLIAMLAADGVDELISISGPAQSVDQTIISQVTKQSPALGSIAEAHFKELQETDSIAQIHPFLGTIFAKQNFAFLQSWMSYNPAEEIKKIKKPILLINGTKDLQVPVEDAQQLHKANPKTELLIIEDMNHVLMEIKKDEDNMKSYFNTGFSISDALIEAVVMFLKK